MPDISGNWENEPDRNRCMLCGKTGLFDKIIHVAGCPNVKTRLEYNAKHRTHEARDKDRTATQAGTQMANRPGVQASNTFYAVYTSGSSSTGNYEIYSGYNTGTGTR